ncbi:type II secretion system F family protein [Comamonas thiooxydans]|uniref:Secretion system protein n=2 Tax=Comamonadaceae TaxID=80864 RepID=A0A454XR09_9BURK|nr:type II secretion system F family protein [Comamonas thiooxydans]ACY35229.1 type II secretion system protein [Comamonas thiooxydans]KGH01004.1 secretion system protein [Comamonas thiooxydans]MBL5977111.1 type II secretion system F family protein [Comamonas sp. NyZ500]MDO1473337.1 secretion system protein [Comamonas thiooxydans]
MASNAFLLLSLALLTAAAAIALWMLVGRQQRTRRMTRHLEQSLEKSAAAAAGFVAKNAASAFDGSVADALLGNEKRTGWPVPAILLGTASAGLFYGGLVLIAVAFLIVGFAVGWLAGSAALVVLGIGFFFLLYTRAQKYRARLTQQLPGFLDNTVRLVTIGNSVQAAFQMAAASTKDPLQSVMEKAASLARAGMDLENAVAHVARQTRLDELHLLAAILRISVRYGGRVDLLLERVANFMRDREQAEQDLSAMTAETRLSAWVLSLLPVAVCCLIISFNASYFLNMWDDASGRNIIGVAAALQVFGVVLLYRLAKLDEGGD